MTLRFVYFLYFWGLNTGGKLDIYTLHNLNWVACSHASACRNPNCCSLFPECNILKILIIIVLHLTLETLERECLELPISQSYRNRLENKASHMHKYWKCFYLSSLTIIYTNILIPYQIKYILSLRLFSNFYFC